MGGPGPLWAGDHLRRRKGVGRLAKRSIEIA